MAGLALSPSIAADAILGFSMSEIAERHGLSKTAVYRRLARAGDELPRRRGRTHGAKTIWQVMELLQSGALGVCEMAREAGVSHQTVIRWRAKLTGDPAAPRVVDAYLCPGCRHRVQHSPCSICRLRAEEKKSA